MHMDSKFVNMLSLYFLKCIAYQYWRKLGVIYDEIDADSMHSVVLRKLRTLMYKLCQIRFLLVVSSCNSTEI